MCSGDCYCSNGMIGIEEFGVMMVMERGFRMGEGGEKEGRLKLCKMRGKWR